MSHSARDKGGERTLGELAPPGHQCIAPTQPWDDGTIASEAV